MLWGVERFFYAFFIQLNMNTYAEKLQSSDKMKMVFGLINNLPFIKQTAVIARRHDEAICQIQAVCLLHNNNS